MGGVDTVTIARRQLFHATLVAAVATACRPGITVDDLVRMYRRREALSDTIALDGPPPIFGHPQADAHIIRLAEARGYTLRRVHNGPRSMVAGVEVDVSVRRPLETLLAAATTAGVDLRVRYGYRSIEQQRDMFLDKLRRVGPERIAGGRADDRVDDALRWVAPPGYSKHHSGLTVDFRNGTDGAAAFAGSASHRWLSDNSDAMARRYGFAPSYPQSAGAQGPDPEAWEYTYIGVAALQCAERLAARTSAGRDDRKADRCLTAGQDVAIAASTRA